MTVLSRVATATGTLPRLLSVRLQDPNVLLSLGLIGGAAAHRTLDDLRPVWARLAARPVYLRWAAYYALLLLLVVLGNWNFAQFVYMQF